MNMNWSRYDRLNEIEKIGWRIGAIRREKKITDTQMANNLQMDIVTYRKIEKSRTEQIESITLQQMYKAIGVLKISVEEIISL